MAVRKTINADPARLATARTVRAVLNCVPTVATGISQYGDNPIPANRIGRAQQAASANEEAIPPATSAIAPPDLTSDFMHVA